MTSYDAATHNFTEKYLGVTAVKVTNTLGRTVKKGELVYLGTWFGNALEDIANGAVGWIDINYEREISTEQIEATDTFTVGSVLYFIPGDASAAGKLADAAGATGVAVGTITGEQGSAGAQTSVQFRPYLQKADVGAFDARVTALEAAAPIGGRPFRVVGTLAAAAAGTAVHLLTAAQVGAGKVAKILGFLLNVGGTTAWTDTTATVVKLQDTADTPVVAATVAKAQLTSQAQLGPLSTGVTLGTPIRTGVGLTAAKGLDIVADANFAAGSDITVTVFGVIEDAE
jgi:hypothetical protein